MRRSFGSPGSPSSSPCRTTFGVLKAYRSYGESFPSAESTIARSDAGSHTVSGRRVEPRSGRSFETSSAVEAERAAIGADQFVICRAALRATVLASQFEALHLEGALSLPIVSTPAVADPPRYYRRPPVSLGQIYAHRHAYEPSGGGEHGTVALALSAPFLADWLRAALHCHLPIAICHRQEIQKLGS